MGEGMEANMCPVTGTLCSLIHFTQAQALTLLRCARAGLQPGPALVVLTDMGGAGGGRPVYLSHKYPCNCR